MLNYRKNALIRDIWCIIYLYNVCFDKIWYSILITCNKMYSICINWISHSKSAPAVPLTGPEMEASAGQISIGFCVVRSMQALCIIYISLIFGFGICICDTFKKSDVGYAEPALLPAKQQISLLLIPCVCRLVLTLTGLSLCVVWLHVWLPASRKIIINLL